MGNTVKTILIMLSVCFVIAVIHAQKPHPFDEHIEWLVENSEFEYNGETYPAVSYHSTEDLQIIAYGADRIEEAEILERTMPKIKALYNHKDNRLMFTEGMDIAAEETAYIVVHELVHFLQNINDVTAQTDCIPSLEEPAYKLQAEWQREHDHPGPYPNFLFVKLLDLGCQR
jgi:hypothetical protein